MDFKIEDIGKKVINTVTGEVGTFIARCDEPSFTVETNKESHSGSVHSPNAKEWKIFEKKTLSDKASIYEGEGEGRTFEFNDVKDAIKELDNGLSNQGFSPATKQKIRKIIDEVFGEDLI